MSLMNGEVVTDDAFQQSLLSLVLEAVSPWIEDRVEDRVEERIEYTPSNIVPIQWEVLQISSCSEQLLVTIKNVSSGQQFTALMCCLSTPEVVAVSQTDGMMSMSNPYFEGGQKIEAELDAPGNWNILSTSFKAQKGATALRFMRDDAAYEINVNQFGCFEIVDWYNSRPVDAFLEVKVDGVWQETVIDAIPYSIEYLVRCWKKASTGRLAKTNRWNRWMTALFVELGGRDRATLQEALMATFIAQQDDYCLKTFKQERRKFLKNEQSPLLWLMHAA